MSENINRFFFSENTVKEDLNEETMALNNYLEVTDAFSRAIYMSVYIIDYQKRNFEYVSENPLFLCGNTAEEVKKMGYEFYFRYVQKSDADLLSKVNRLGYEFYEKIPAEERKYYTLSYDIHLLNKDKAILVNQKLTPLFLTEEGKIWKAMGVVSLSTNTNSGNITISRQGTNDYWWYDAEEEKWRNEEKIKLSERELEVLRYYAQGYTINKIAEKIFVSPDTIKFHRRKLFEKMQVSNISEALAFVTSNKLL
ncbi:helix-turn-helix transcriptional regulator [Chryseobacterium sp. T16E-39]|uniref:response regulator transcription factor n=1 Tax=Chryseobacterium sp. T16E-39 TaxID=2015076 RepID=UPI000B5B4564|nr:helix-turn-helix transcriptional regulator [Chryseobacterium sp. T16E-39]ASK30178.1 helix-turn-helix transcriptional regulator [Chryseobacterium sp. T16E-39]